MSDDQQIDNDEIVNDQQVDGDQEPEQEPKIVPKPE